MRVNGKRVVTRLNEIYQCGKKEDGTYTRMAFSAEDIKGRKLFASWAQKLGMTVRMDEGGNLIARMDGQDNNLLVTYTNAELGLSPGEVGIEGSPTVVVDSFSPKSGRKAAMLEETPAELARKLKELIEEEKGK